MTSRRLYRFVGIMAVAGCAAEDAPLNTAPNHGTQKEAAQDIGGEHLPPARTEGLPQVETTAVASADDQLPAQRQGKVDVVEYDPAPVTDDAFTLEEGFETLTLDNFNAFQAESGAWTAVGDEIHCTGKPKGYLYSKDSFQNFTWRLEYRFKRPTTLKEEAKFKGNTGYMIYISGEHKIWPVSLEVQGKHAEMAAIKANGGAAPVTVQDDDAARQAARQSVGHWNRLEIVSRDGALNVTLNDRPISRSEPNFLSAGQIGIQAEDHPFVVRRLRIRRE